MRWWSIQLWRVTAILLSLGLSPGFSASLRAEEVQVHGDTPRTGESAKPNTHADGGEAEGPMTAHQNDVDLAVWTLITFVVFVAVLKKLAWSPIIEGLQKRESSMFDNLAAAESARIKAEKMLAEHAAKLDKVQDEVREILAEAKRDAEHTKTEILAVAQKEAEATRQRAVNDIERARDQALDELFNQVGRAVYLATEQVLGRSVTGADNDRLIDEALAGFAQRKH
jgi:F-type H+-transporting ATPase subunit b